jgi:DNA-binding beta-propeller fold protein YncE
LLRLQRESWKEKLLRKVMLVVFAALALAFVSASCACAARGDLVATYTFGARKLTLDPLTHRVYASNTIQNSIGVFNSLSPAQLATISVGAGPMGAAVSPDGSRVYVANSLENSVSVINATTLTSAGSFSTQWKMWDIEMGGGYLYATQGQNSGYHGILKMDAVTGAIASEFGGSYYKGMLEISPDRRYLYYGDSGLSPASAAKYDLSAPGMPDVAGVSGLGSNGQEMTLSHDGQKVYWGLGGWMGFGYKTPELNSSNMQMSYAINAAQCTSLALSPTDAYLYSVSGSNGEVRIWNLATYTQIGAIAVPDGAWDIVVNETGSRIFVSYDNQIKVYDTGFAPVPEPSSLLGLLSGITGIAVALKKRAVRR